MEITPLTVLLVTHKIASELSLGLLLRQLLQWVHISFLVWIPHKVTKLISLFFFLEKLRDCEISLLRGTEHTKDLRHAELY